MTSSDAASRTCTDCVNEYRREYTGRSAVKLRARWRYVEKKLGIEQRAYHVAWAAQDGGLCGVCRDQLIDVMGEKRHPMLAVIDVDPSTHLVRGLLCARCTEALTLMRYQGGLLTSAAAYVEADPELARRKIVPATGA